MAEQINPNSLKYFDEKKGCTFNHQCPKCKKLTWMSERVQTIFHGKRFFRNTYDNPYPVGVCTLDGEVWCWKCWEKEGKDNEDQSKIKVPKQENE